MLFSGIDIELIQEDNDIWIYRFIFEPGVRTLGYTLVYFQSEWRFVVKEPINFGMGEDFTPDLEYIN